MTARRDASRPERKGAAERAKNNPDWFYPSPRQEPEKGPASAAEIHAHVVGAVAGSGAADESSDSEAEQEGPQKLIRKVSTSGQIRSKVRRIWLLVFVLLPCMCGCGFYTVGCCWGIHALVSVACGQGQSLRYKMSGQASCWVVPEPDTDSLSDPRAE